MGSGAPVAHELLLAKWSLLDFFEQLRGAKQRKRRLPRFRTWDFLQPVHNTVQVDCSCHENMLEVGFRQSNVARTTVLGQIALVVKLFGVAA